MRILCFFLCGSYGGAFNSYSRFVLYLTPYMSYLCLRICTYCITYYHRLVFWGKEVWGDIGGVSPLLLEPAALLPAAECFRSATFLLGSPAGFCSATARGCFRFGQRPLPLFWADVFPDCLLFIYFSVGGYIGLGGWVQACFAH